MINNSLPRISIVTPVLNRVDYIEETILSVISQNYPNLEYMVIDGGSTDGTIEVIKKYENEITFWESEPDKGMYYAIQKGFEKSTGDIMAWINSDDKYYQSSLYTVAQIFSDLSNIEWITGTPTILNKKGFCVKVTPGIRWSFSRIQIGDYRWIQQESIFWKRTLWQKTGSQLNTHYQYAADFDLWCRFFYHADLYSVSAPLSGFRLHGSQISLIYTEYYEKEVLEILKSLTTEPGGLKRLSHIKRFWNWSKYLINLNNNPAKALALFIAHIVQKMHNFPPFIYFDFEENKWEM